MADWYVSSVAYAALSQFAVSTAYTLGQIVRPLTTPAFGATYCFRVTTAGTSAGTEPTWPANNNATVTSGTAVFTNVSGQSTYNWSAPAGNVYSLGASGVGTVRFVAGDRVFLSSDHAESSTSLIYSLITTAGWTGLRVISVNRAGSVPPVAADITSGAAITYTGSSAWVLDCYIPTFWQGVTFTIGGSSTGAYLANSGDKRHYFKNCAFVFTTSTTNATLMTNDAIAVTLDNSTVTFNAAGQKINVVSYPLELTWINTASPLPGTVPTALFGSSNAAVLDVRMRGVDLSALTTALVAVSSVFCGGVRALLDSCRIAPGLARLNFANLGTGTIAHDEIELINCYDGSNIISERHTAMGSATWETTIVMTGGAQDDVGVYAIKVFAGNRTDQWANMMDGFWLDVENTVTSSTHTATVEILSGALLNNNDVRLVLYYEGTSGSSLASITETLATVLTPAAALSSSAATWGSATNTLDPAFASSTVTLSNGNLTVTAITNAILYPVRTVGPILTGKLYFEATVVAIGANNNIAIGIGNMLVSNAAGSGLGTASTANSYAYNAGGSVYTATASQGSIGTYTTADVICVAVDIANKKVWFRKNGGSWDNNGTHNPATNTGGFDITTLLANHGSLYPMVQVYNSTDSLTINLGSTSFAQTAPSGFSGLTTTANLVPQYLQASFAPRQAGRLRGQIRVGKSNTDVWVNPQITVS